MGFVKQIWDSIRFQLPASKRALREFSQNTNKRLIRQKELLENAIIAIKTQKQTDDIFKFKAIRGGVEGQISFYLPFKNDYITREIIINGDFFDIDTIKLADEYLKDGANILDIGSNIGNNAVYYATQRAANKIYCFEPMADVYGILCKNIELNGLNDRVVAYNFGLGECEQKASVKGRRPTENLGGTSLKPDENGELVIKRLDDLQIPEKIDFIKMDVEGFEADALKGATQFLKAHKPNIQIEIFEQHYKTVSKILSDIGYVLTKKIGYCDYVFVYKS